MRERSRLPVPLTASSHDTAAHCRAHRYVEVVDELSRGAWRVGAEGGTYGSSALTGTSPMSMRSQNKILPTSSASTKMTAASEALLRARLAELEAEVASLRTPEMRGWLFKFSPDGGSWLPTVGASSRWGRRYFVLNQGVLKYYSSEGNMEMPRRSVPLANVLVYDEGRKDTSRHVALNNFGGMLGRKNTPLVSYHVFSLYLEGTFGTDRGPGSGALLRLSSSSSAEARQWMACLEKSGAKIISSPASVQTGHNLAMPSPARPRGGFDPFLFPASRPMHMRMQPSLLSHEGQARSDFSGLVNLGESASAKGSGWAQSLPVQNAQPYYAFEPPTDGVGVALRLRAYYSVLNTHSPHPRELFEVWPAHPDPVASNAIAAASLESSTQAPAIGSMAGLQ